MLEYGACLLERHAGEPLDELMDGCVVFEILEERCHRHARPTENPCAAEASGVALDGSACGPVDHGEMVAMGAFVKATEYDVTSPTCPGVMQSVLRRLYRPMPAVFASSSSNRNLMSSTFEGLTVITIVVHAPLLRVSVIDTSFADLSASVRSLP